MTDGGFVSFEHVLSEVAKGANAFICASGGLDSAYLLYKYASLFPDKTLNVHHISMYPSSRPRHVIEKACLGKQLDMLDVKVNLVNSTYDLDQDADHLNIPDWFVSALLTVGYAYKQNVDYVCCGDEIIDGFTRLSAYRQEPDPIYQKQKDSLLSICTSLTLGKVKVSHELEEGDLLAEYMNTMPDEYLATCFSCRKPRFANGYAEACGVDCPSCYRNYSFGIKDKLCKRLRLDQ